MKQFYLDRLNDLASEIKAPEHQFEQLELLYRAGFAAGLGCVLNEFGDKIDKKAARQIATFGFELASESFSKETLQATPKVIAQNGDLEGTQNALEDSVCLMIDFEEEVDANLHCAISVIFEQQLISYDGQTYLLNRWPKDYSIQDFYALANKYKIPLSLGKYKLNEDCVLRNKQRWRATKSGWKQRT